MIQLKLLIMLVLSFLIFTNLVLSQSLNLSRREIDKSSTSHLRISSKDSIPDSSMFILKRIKYDMNTQSVNIIKKCKELNKKQIKKWLSPIYQGFEAQSYKMLSFQKQTHTYISMVLCEIFGYYEGYDEVPPFYDMQQFLVNVDRKTGKYIDGIIIQTYIPGSFYGDSVFVGKGLIMGIAVNSKLLGDTIYLINKSRYLNPPNSQSKKDIWEEKIVEKYIILENGMFMKND